MSCIEVLVMDKRSEAEVDGLVQSLNDTKLGIEPVGTPARQNKTKQKLPIRGVQSEELEKWIKIKLIDMGILKESEEEK